MDNAIICMCEIVGGNLYLYSSVSLASQDRNSLLELMEQSTSAEDETVFLTVESREHAESLARQLGLRLHVLVNQAEE